LQLERRFGRALEAELVAAPFALPLERDGRCGTSLFLATGQLDIDGGAAARIVEAQATIVDPQSTQLQGVATVILEAEIPIARAAVWAGFQAHVRLHQAQLGQPDLA